MLKNPEDKSIENESQTNLTDLRKVLRKEPYKTAVFIGAGTSIIPGIADWNNVIKEMAKHFESKNYSESCIDELIKIDQVNHPKIASEIFKEKNDLQFYLKFMGKRFEPTKTHYSAVHIKLLKLFNCFFTTNFDSCLEEAFKDSNDSNSDNLTLKVLPDLSMIDLNKSKTVFYLHGHKDKGVYVFREEEYKVYYPSNYTQESSECSDFCLENALETMIKQLNILFIGFSFRDEHFRKFMYKVIKEKIENSRKSYKMLFDKELDYSMRKRFALISKEVYKKEHSFFEEMGIKCIIFNKYIQIEHYLQSLQNLDNTELYQGAFYDKS